MEYDVDYESLELDDHGGNIIFLNYSILIITNEGDLKVKDSILVDIDLVWSHIKSLYKLSDNVLIKRLDALMFTKKQILSEI